MSNAIILAQKGAIDKSFDLLNQFIETCPDHIWAENNGGWPVWQQVYHALNAIAFFTGLNEGLPALAEPEVGSLKKTATTTVSRDQLKTALTAARATAEKYIASISDSDLPQRNEAVFAAVKWDITHAFTLSMLTGHNLYHLGGCDAALRDHGLKGVF